MKIFITGISGFAGKNFVEMLSHKNEQFEVLGTYFQNEPNFPKNGYPNVQLKTIKIDLEIKHGLDNILSEFNPDYIIHFAAKSSVGDSWIHPADCIMENTGIFINLLETMRKYELKGKILSIGSAEEYGPMEFHEGIKSYSEKLPSNPINPYGTTKVMQRKLVEIYAKSYGINVLHTRSFNHYGFYQNEKFVLPTFGKQIATAIKENRPIELKTGNLNVVRDFTDVRDVSLAYYELLQKGKIGETYNVCSGKAYSLFDILNIFEKIVGQEIKHSTDSDKLRNAESNVQIGDNTKIFEATGWQPKISIEKGLTDLLNYWSEQIKD